MDAKAKGKVIHSKERNVIKNVLHFFENEAHSGKLIIPIQQAQKRTAAATGISLRTINRIKKEAALAPILSSPSRRKPQTTRNAFLNVGDSDLCVIRQTINELYLSNKMPTLTNLLPVIKEKINFPWQKQTMRKILRQIGFGWKRCQDSKSVLVEKEDIVQWRYRYLKEIKKHRDSERPIIYLDETWIDSNLYFGKCWQVGKKGVFKQKFAGKKLMLLHAGHQNGLIKEATLVFQSDTTSGNYCGEMNFENFSNWLKEKVLPNIPCNSVICMDDASYHSKVFNPIPSKYATKMELFQWLEEKQVPHNPDMRKTELYDLIVANAPPAKKYSVDEILIEKGHEVLRIPPYHCDLNLMELALVLTKRYVKEANRNAVLNFQTLKNHLASEAFAAITEEQWKEYGEHVKINEKSYWEIDNLVEDIKEEMSFLVGSDSSEYESDLTETVESDLEDSDIDSTAFPALFQALTQS